MDVLQSISMLAGSGGIFGAVVVFFKTLAKFRRTPELNRRTAAQTDSMTATATRLLVEPLERVIAQKDAVIAQRDSEIDRVKDTSVRRLGLLRWLLHHHDDVIDAAIVAGARMDDLPPMPEDKRTALDQELE